jgi:hypothetical protein
VYWGKILNNNILSVFIMGKNIIFYSNYCEYSKEILDKLRNGNILDTMVEVCVDDRKIRLPPFVTAVPTIYLTDKQSIIIDEQIAEWITSLMPKQQVQVPELGAYMGGGVLGDGFAFLDDSADNSESCTLTFLDQDVSIPTPNETKLKSRTMEDMEKERSMDMKMNSDNMPKRI